MILTPDDVRASVTTTASDAALELQIAAAEAQLELVAGALGEVREERAGGARALVLARHAASIRRIREYAASADLTDDDWHLASDGRTLWRRYGGAPAYWADGPVLVYYQPRDALLVWRATAMQLIKHNLVTTPGVLGFTEGNFSIQFPNGETWASTHEEILATLAAPWHFG